MNIAQPKEQILVEEFRKLLQKMSEPSSDGRIKFQKGGALWQRNFVQVFDADKGGVFYDHEDQEFIYVSDISEITGFQLSKAIGSFKPQTIYEVVPIRFI